MSRLRKPRVFAPPVLEDVFNQHGIAIGDASLAGFNLCRFWMTTLGIQFLTPNPGDFNNYNSSELMAKWRNPYNTQPPEIFRIAKHHVGSRKSPRQMYIVCVVERYQQFIWTSINSTSDWPQKWFGQLHFYRAFVHIYLAQGPRWERNFRNGDGTEIALHILIR